MNYNFKIALRKNQRALSDLLSITRTGLYISGLALKHYKTKSTYDICYDETNKALMLKESEEERKITIMKGGRYAFITMAGLKNVMPVGIYLPVGDDIYVLKERKQL